MAHHRLMHDNTAAIFSPSVARIAASTAREWSHVDAWLASKFSNRADPLLQFERNPDTLRALSALAALNESADDQRRLLARADSAALQELNAASAGDDSRSGSGAAGSLGLARGPPGMREDILDAVGQGLCKEGSNALDALARLCSEAGTAYADPSDLGRTMLRLQGSIYETDQMRARVEMLERQLKAESDSAEQLLQGLQGDEYKQPPEMAKQNLDTQRKIKAMSAQLPDLVDRVGSIEATMSLSHPGVEDITREEQALLALIVRRKELEAQLASFEGAPADPGAAQADE
ncbi:hypothetical protein ESCO_002576 [Escovopsis weberi]|uniref:HAUS augmin-like complex subunit 1 n=1 Tax=Escovopsis weberi TaxID=150374 RepID=A0A0M8MWK2_ESCWE|nr:hypothetical protein ESCO_002576 [Escovopsis weberi]